MYVFQPFPVSFLTKQQITVLVDACDKTKLHSILFQTLHGLVHLQPAERTSLEPLEALLARLIVQPSVLADLTESNLLKRFIKLCMKFDDKQQEIWKEKYCSLCTVFSCD